MPTWEEAADAVGLNPTERSHFKDAIKLLGTRGVGFAVRVANNIDHEFRVPDTAWQKIFSAIQTVDLSDKDVTTANQVLDAFRGALGACMDAAFNMPGVPSRLPLGPVVSDLKPKAYGRLMTLPALVNAWKGRVLTRLGATSSRRPASPARVARELIEDLQQPVGFAARSGDPSLARLPLGFYVLWSTFDGETFDVDPFPPRPARVRSLAACLGTDHQTLFDRPRPPRALCVLLTYRLPDDVDPRVPTIVEAYAGSRRLNYYFEVFRHDVSVNQKQFPRTLPIPEAADEPGRPEVVHEVIFADQLTGPLELAPF